MIEMKEEVKTPGNSILKTTNSLSQKWHIYNTYNSRADTALETEIQILVQPTSLRLDLYHEIINPETTNNKDAQKSSNIFRKFFVSVQFLLKNFCQKLILTHILIFCQEFFFETSKDHIRRYNHAYRVGFTPAMSKNKSTCSDFSLVSTARPFDWISSNSWEDFHSCTLKELVFPEITSKFVSKHFGDFRRFEGSCDSSFLRKSFRTKSKFNRNC